MKTILGLLLTLSPLAGLAQQSAPNTKANVVVVQQSGSGSQQASIVQTGSDNVATIRQDNGAYSTRAVTSVQVGAGHTIIRQSSDGRSVFIQQSGLAQPGPVMADSTATKKSGNTLKKN